MSRTNPNGANQYQLDPRQKLCWDLYVNPKSETFGNALQSAIKAGYEPYYAATITSTEWFYEKVRRLNLLSKAEKVLDNTLDYDPKDPTTGKIDSALARVILDAGKFVAERRGKDEGYSSRSEVTGKDGASLFEVEITPEDEELLELIAQHERDKDTEAVEADGNEAQSLGEEV